MKNLNYNSIIDVNNNQINSIFGTFDSKNFNSITSNNNIKNNFNYNFKTGVFSHKNRRKKRIIRRESNQNCLYSNCDIGYSLSYIKRQLNNIAVSEKNSLKIPTIRISESFSRNNNLSTTNSSSNLKYVLKKYKQSNENKKVILKKSNQIFFSILKSNSEKCELIKTINSLQNENDLLRDNIKYLILQIKNLERSEKKYNNNPQSKNKINNIFDILDKYKKEIISLEQKLNDLSIENEKLKKYISNNSKIKNEINICDNNKIFHNRNSLRKRHIFNKKIPFNRNDKKDNLITYKRKTLQKTYSSLKIDSYNNYLTDSNHLENYLKTDNNYNNNNCSNNTNYSFHETEQSYNKNNNLVNSFNAKSKHLILIDSDFTGDEKIENKVSNNSCDNNKKKTNFSSERFHLSKKRNNALKSSSSFKSELYCKKQLNLNKNLQIPIDKEILQRDKFLNKYNKDNSTKYTISPKIKYEDNIYKLDILKKN